MMQLVARLRHLLSMPQAELISRANAWSEVQTAGRELCAAIETGDTAQTSHAMASLAGAIMAKTVRVGPQPEVEYNQLLHAAKQLAGSALAQYAGDPEPLPLDQAASRALADAQRHGQADPLIKTVTIKYDPSAQPLNEEPDA